MNDEQLKELSKEYELNPAVPEELPKPTFWPVMTAFSAVFFFGGFITSLIISGVGIVFLGISITGWIGEFNNE